MTACMPTVVDASRDIFDAHDIYDFLLLSEGLSGDQIVSNDILMDASCDGILIRGNNSSGKTVYLRSLGIAQLFAQAGLPVCAKSDQFYYRAEAEMRELFPDHPEAIDNTVKIADRCVFEVKTGIGDDFWPRYEIPKEFLESEECKEIYRVMEDEYNKGYPEAFEKAAKEFCKKNKDKTIETLTDEDKDAVEKIMEHNKTRGEGSVYIYLDYSHACSTCLP